MQITNPEHREIQYEGKKRRSQMEKTIKKLLFIVFGVLLITVFYPCKAEAKSYYNYKTIPTKQNTWIKSKGIERSEKEKNKYYYTVYAYKINVPGHGYVKVETRGKKGDKIDFKRKIKKDKNNPSGFQNIEWRKLEKKNDTVYMVLPRGISYIVTDEPYKFKYSFVKVADSGNYCRSKAKKLEPGKLETVVFQSGYSYNKLYKIVLTKDQPLKVYKKTLYETSLSKEFKLFDVSGNEISCPEWEENKSYKTEKLKKGTYYLILESPSFDEYGGLYQLSWK